MAKPQRKAARKPKAKPQAEEAAAQAEAPADKPQGEPEEAAEASEDQSGASEDPADATGEGQVSDALGDSEEEGAKELPSANEALLKRIAELEARNAALEAEKAEAAEKEAAPAPQARKAPGLTSADLQLSGKPKEPEPKELTKAQRHWRTAEAGVMKRRGKDLGPQTRKVYAVKNQNPRNSEICLEDGTVYVAEFRMTSDAAIPVAMVPQKVYEQMSRLFRGKGNYAFEDEL